MTVTRVLARVKAASKHRAQIALMKFLSAVADRENVADHVYVVGGAVRNFVLDQPIKDLDVVVDSVALGGKDSAWFAKALQRAIPAAVDLTTNQYGVAILTVKGTWILDGHDMDGEVIEIANARKESYGGSGDGKGYKPNMVEPATIDEDVFRREFTFNCMAGDTLIPTEKGILRIDQIASRTGGDQQSIHLTVAGQNGPSLAVGWQYSGFAPTLQVTTEWGHSFACTHHHPVLVLRGHDHEWVQADQLDEGDLLCVPVQKMTRQDPLLLNLSDPTPPKRGGLKKVHKPTVMTPELAFIMGCIVAEGSNTNTRLSFSNSDLNFISRYEECFHTVFGFTPLRHRVVCEGSVRNLNGVDFVANADSYAVYADSKTVVGWMSDLGMYCGGAQGGKTASYYKVVPWAILQADEQSQIAFLAAYLEGDGSIRPDSGRMVFRSVSPHIRQHLQVLMLAHGVLSKVDGDFVHVNAVDSSILWEKVKPWMVTKHFDYSTHTFKSRNRYGIPVGYLAGFLESRRRVSAGKMGVVYITDSGEPQILQGMHEPIRRIHRLLYDAYARGDFEGFMEGLHKISPKEHTKIKHLFDLGYQYVKVTSIKDAGMQDVFDISMGAGVEPAFVANGVVVHNTLLWKLRDLTTGPENAEIIDLTGCGLRDLQDGILRCPQDPDIVFSDDPTRLLRIIKFVAKYGFKIPDDVASSARRNAKKMKNAPWEAIASIFVNNVLAEPTAPRALKLMKSLGLLDVVAEMIQEQKPFAAYMARDLRGRNVSLLLDLLDLGLSDPSPLRYLTPAQQARLREITIVMHHAEADAFAATLALPKINNQLFIDSYGLEGRDRTLPVQIAREILLDMPDLAGNMVRLNDLVDQQLSVRRVVQRYAAQVLQFKKAPKHTITLNGRKYALSKYSNFGLEDLEEEEGGARLIDMEHSQPYRFLWLLEEARQEVMVFRVTDGSEKASGHARHFMSAIIKLDQLGELNRVTRQELDVVQREMAERESENLRALEEWAEELGGEYQKEVNRIAIEVFDRDFVPEIKRRLREVELGVIPYGFKVNSHLLGFQSEEAQIRQYVVAQVTADFTVELIEEEMRKQGLDPETPGRDSQAAYWALNDIRQHHNF